jgi:hypothetical protein
MPPRQSLGPSLHPDAVPSRLGQLGHISVLESKSKTTTSPRMHAVCANDMLLQATSVQLNLGSRLFDSSQNRIQARDVGSQIPTVRTFVLERTVGLELVVSPVAVVVLDKNTARIGREQVS